MIENQCKCRCKTIPYIITIIITAIVVGGGMYYWQNSNNTDQSSLPQTVVTTNTAKTLTFKDKIEDFSSYQKSNYNNFPTYGCSNYTNFHSKLTSGEIKEKILYNSSLYPFTIYLTPNYENWTTDEFKKVNSCIEGTGQISALKAYSNYLLWGLTNCGGASTGSSDQAKCEEVALELNKYLGNKSSFDTSSATTGKTSSKIVEFNCKQSGGTYKNGKCDCSALKASDQFARYEEGTGYCITAIGSPGGQLGEDVKNLQKLKMLESKTK